MRMMHTRTYPVQKLINGQWGYAYNQERKIMLGGYSADGMSFTHTFTVVDVEKDELMFAVALCGLLYGKNREVVTSYHELVGEDESCWRLYRYDVELHNK